MPNHVTTVLVAPEEVIDAMIDPEGIVRNNWGGFEDPVVVDFDRIVPSPPNKEMGSCNGSHDPGVICWYEWNREHWGTKWGAYEAGRINPATVQFDTAWQHPEPIMLVLSRKFPDAVLHVQYADEDLGYNLGEYWVQDGEITQQMVMTPGSDDAKDFASHLKHGQSYAEVRAEW